MLFLFVFVGVYLSSFIDKGSVDYINIFYGVINQLSLFNFK